MKYHIQPNSDQTYTVLEIDGTEEARCYIVEKMTATDMFNLGKQNQLQVVLYNENGQIEQTCLGMTRKLFKRNKSQIFPLICCGAILSSGFAGVSELIFAAILVAIFQTLQYRKMMKLKKEIDAQRYLFSVQPTKIIKLRESNQNLRKKYLRAMFAETASLCLIFLILGATYLLNNGQEFAPRFFVDRRVRRTHFEGPLFEKFGEGTTYVVYILIFAGIGLYCASIYYLRCKDYVDSEVLNYYRGLKAKLTNGDFLGWEFSNQLPSLEIPSYGWSVKGQKRVGTGTLIEQTNKKIQELYQNRWE